jgi:arylsulfatase
MTRSVLFGSLAALAATICAPANAQQPRKPNIVIIWGDDIGQSNVSAYSRGMMGYKTPNIDRVANEGVMFTDYYAEQSCTAGRASFITGQSGLRTGMTKVGLRERRLGCRRKIRRLPSCSSRLVMRPDSSARTI